MRPLRHHAFVRRGAVALVVARSLPAYLWLLLRGAVRLPAGEAAWERVHTRTAVRADRLVAWLGGMIVKGAQIVGARPDVFPAPFVTRLRRYHDAVAPRPFESLRPGLERDLGVALDGVFEWIDPEALAAASIAQVHRARLRDGRDVVLKIQYPEVAALAPVDLGTLATVAALVGRLSGSDIASLGREIRRFVALELDFEREARFTERAARDLAGLAGVRVPELVRDLCRSRVLVLEHLEGIPISDVAALRRAGHDPAEVARQVARLYATMIFERGFFHGDPHPGNLLVLEDGGIGLLDFGLCKELPDGFAPSVARLLVAGMSGDGEAALAAARELGFEIDGIDPEQGARLLRLFLGDTSQGFLPEVVRATRVARIPEDFGLVFRTLVLLAGLSHTLAPGAHVIQQELARVILPIAAHRPTAGAA